MRIHIFQEYIENTKNTKRYYMYSVFILIENTPKSNRKHPSSPLRRQVGTVLEHVFFAVAVVDHHHAVLALGAPLSFVASEADLQAGKVVGLWCCW